MNGWQPIETAPKDGESVLLSLVTGDGSTVMAGHWDDDQNVWKIYPSGSWTTVSHWKRFPSPPSLSHQEKGE